MRGQASCQYWQLVWPLVTDNWQPLQFFAVLQLATSIQAVWQLRVYSPPPESSLTMLLTKAFASPNNIKVLSM